VSPGLRRRTLGVGLRLRLGLGLGLGATAADAAAAATAFAVMLVLVLAPRAALARSVARLRYPRAEVWSTAVRWLRVNGNLPIREKDEGAGYVLFDYLEGGKVYRASLELVAPGGAAGADGEATDVVVSISDLPRRFEAQVLDRLAQKLRDERGPPPERHARPAPDKDRPGQGEGRGDDRGEGQGDAGVSNRLPRAQSAPSGTASP
jgi:hypothetical protein